MSTSPWTEPPRQRSIGPARGPRSIFTLRPSSRTEQPPPEPGPPAGKRKWAMIAFAACGAALVAWSVAPHRATPPSAPVVYVNGTPKIKETPSGQSERWGQASELTIYIDDSVDQIGPGAREAVINAFGAWVGSGATLPKLRFDTTSGTKPQVERDGKSTVVFAPIEISGHKNDVAITIGFATPGNGRLVEADIVLNADKKFALLPPEADGAPHDSPSCNARYDLQSVVTHESGHFFGLDEDTDDGDATMYFKTGKCELKKRDLSAPDTSTMTSLYAGSFDTEPEPENTTATGCSMTRTNSAGFGAFVSALLCSIGIRSARRRTARRGSK